MMDAEKLKPCLFCGGNNLRVVEYEEDEAYAVHCFSCLSYGPMKVNEEKAIAAWNRRAANA